MTARILKVVPRGRASADSGGRRESDRAHERLRRAIVRCELRPGSLQSEAELAARFRLKRAATRSALDRLSVSGLLRPLHRRGYVVKPITLRDVDDLFELRVIVETAVVALAAGRVDAARLRRLDDVCSAGYLPSDRHSEARYLEANTAFHLTIAAATGNERLLGLLGQIVGEMERLFHFGLAVCNRTEELRRGHRALVDALAAGDTLLAERLVREELASAKAMVLDALLSSDALPDVSIGSAVAGSP